MLEADQIEMAKRDQLPSAKISISEIFARKRRVSLTHFQNVSRIELNKLLTFNNLI
jgi:hypothetical protein